MNAADAERVVESMAESAHDAWLQACVGMGYMSRKAEWGEEFMVPFDKLSERGKEFDRVIMRAILVALDEQGFAVVSRTTAPKDAAE